VGSKQAGTGTHPHRRNIDNPAYAKEDEPIDLPINSLVHEHSAEPYVEFNSTTLNNLIERSDAESAYNHINNGPTTARVNDATYSHIPMSEMYVVDHTYSYLLKQHKQNQYYVEERVNEETDPTYNHLQETDAGQLEAKHTERGQIDAASDKSNTEDTYCHLCQENNEPEDRKYLHDRDSTYNHLGDLTTDQNQIVPSLDSKSSANNANLHNYMNYTIGAYSYASSDNSCRNCGRETYSYATPPNQLNGNLELEKDKNGYLIL